MKSFFSKFRKALSKIVNDFKTSAKHFPLSIAFCRLFHDLARGKTLSPFKRIFKNKLHKNILKYLYKKYVYIIEKHTHETVFTAEKQNPNDKKIWVLWWQGIDSAPEIVKICVRSIQKNSNGHEVVFLNQSNYLQYINMPYALIQKFENGNIGYAHYSDIVRTKLLTHHGGLWIDATIFCQKDIPNFVFENDFFTCKNTPDYSNYFTGEQWTTFCLGSTKNGLLFRVLDELFLSYWEEESAAIDYLLMDYFILIIRDTLPVVKSIMDNLCENNSLLNEYASVMSKAFEEKRYISLIKSDTFLFKLSWREKYDEYTKDGKKTFYKHFLEGEVYKNE